MNEERFRAFIAAAPWKFARTMPENPHEYTLPHASSADAFEKAVLDIRECGVRRKFGGRDYVCYDMDGWRYWTMGAPLPETILINRARIPTDAVAGDE